MITGEKTDICSTCEQWETDLSAVFVYQQKSVLTELWSVVHMADWNITSERCYGIMWSKITLMLSLM